MTEFPNIFLKRELAPIELVRCDRQTQERDEPVWRKEH